MIALLLALQITLPADADSLRATAREFNVPPVVLVAVAIVESGYRGGNHWRGAGRLAADGGRWCREVGRMQHSPCEDWRWLTPWCDPAKIRVSYSHNIRCAAARLAYHRLQFGNWGGAVQRYNGSGPRAREYRAKVERVAGALILMEAL